jgi:hypothetical protein
MQHGLLIYSNTRRALLDLVKYLNQMNVIRILITLAGIKKPIESAA